MFILRDREAMRRSWKLLGYFCLLTFLTSVLIKIVSPEMENFLWYLVLTYLFMIIPRLGHVAYQVVSKKKSAFHWNEASRRLNICLLKEVFDFNLAWFFERFMKNKLFIDPLQLKIELEDTQIMDAPWQGLAAHLPQYKNVEYLILSVKNCASVAQRHLQPVFSSAETMEKMKTVNMSFTNVSVVEHSIKSFMTCLSKKNSMASLHLNLKNFSLSGAETIGSGLQCFRNLESLHIFTDLRTDYELKCLVRGLMNLENLESLKLSFENITLFGVNEIFKRLNTPRLAFLKIMTKKLLKPISVWDELDYIKNILTVAVTKLKTMRYFELCIIGKSKRHALCGLSEFCAQRNRLMVITKAFKEKGLSRFSKEKILKRYDHILDVLELYG